MASEQFSLCWDNFHKNMSSGMNSLLENEDLVDVTLAMEGKYLKAHKMVLSVCSPYFRELFKATPCKHPIVFMKDVSYVAMSDLLQFMYQGEVQVSQENLTTFIKTAEALQIKGLTGDGNGSAECDNDPQDEPKPHRELEPPKMMRQKKVVHPPPPPAPAPKRPRLSQPEPPPTAPAITKTEPASTSTSSNELIQFKMEPYDQGQSSSVTIADDNPDDTFGDDPLDDTNADDGNEDYSMMEGGDEEPQAGTSADGTAGEGQGTVFSFKKDLKEIKKDIIEFKIEFSKLKQELFEELQRQYIGIIVSLDKIHSEILLEADASPDKDESITAANANNEDLLKKIKFPVSSCEDVSKLNQEIINDYTFRKGLIDFLSRVGGTTGLEDGNKVAYKITDILFDPNVLTKYTWTGVTRKKGEEKRPFLNMSGILEVVYQVLHKADNRFSKQKTQAIFKDAILKHAKKRCHRKKRYLLCAEYKRLSCKARAQVPLDGTLEDLVLRNDHNHPPFEEASIKDVFITELKSHIDCRPTVPLREIYDCVSILHPQGAELCPYKKVAPSMRRWRQQAIEYNEFMKNY